MGSLTSYLIYFIIPMIFGFAIQAWLRSTFNANSQKPIATGKTGAEVAREILDRNGLRDVPVQMSRQGALSDHYDPRTRAVALSEQVYAGRSVASTAVAAHEVGHALQHAHGYFPMSVRAAIWPVAAFGSQAWFILLIAGFFLNLAGLVMAAVVIYGFVVLFQLVTLPVEFNASRRAAAQLQDFGLVTNAGEVAGVRQTLTAAAMTYVAGALAAIGQLLFFLSMFLGGRD
ncbi:MAG: zinc metallopeptidase [Thermoleophilia bacterium]